MAMMGVQGTDEVWVALTFGNVYHWVPGTQPQQETAPALSAHVYGFWTNGTRQIAVGQDGTAVSRTSGSWSGISTGVTAQLNAVGGRSESDLWFVGATGTVVHFDGGQALQVSSGTTNDLNAISVLPDGRAWAVGASGTVIRYTP
jgi:hypothetical protein